MTLLRRADVTLDESGAAWLTAVAVYEGWRLVRRSEVPAGVMPRLFKDDVVATDDQALAQIEHAERVADVRELKPRERRELYLQALGYRYEEIAALS